MAVKYKLVCDELEKEILQGKYPSSSKLPTEEELMRKFDVSRNTIRKAIEILVDKGYIYQVQGSGIFLREFSKEGCIPLNGMKGLTKEFAKDVLTSELLELTVIEASEELSEKMKCKKGTEVYHIRRIRYLNSEPYAYEESYYNKEIIPYLNKEICDDSIYEYIEKALKLNIGFADKVVYCEKLKENEAKILGLNEGEPTLVVENTAFLNTGVVFDVSREKYNYTKAKLLSLGKN